MLLLQFALDGTELAVLGADGAANAGLLVDLSDLGGLQSLQRAGGASLSALAAAAALVVVDHRQVVLHGDGLKLAGLHALLAADAAVLAHIHDSLELVGVVAEQSHFVLLSFQSQHALGAGSNALAAGSALLFVHHGQLLDGIDVDRVKGASLHTGNRPDEDMPSDEPVVFYDIEDTLALDLNGVKSEKGKSYSLALVVNNPGWYNITLTASSEQSELAQIPVTIFTMGTANAVFTWNGTGGKPVSFTKEIPFFSHYMAVRLYFAQNGLDLIELKFEKTDRTDRPMEGGEI